LQETIKYNNNLAGKNSKNIQIADTIIRTATNT